MPLELNPQITKILVQTTPKMEEMINRFERKLFSSKGASRRELTAIVKDGVDYCMDHFKSGVGIDNQADLAQWATTWNECSVMLGNYMCSSPTLLIESGLIKDCMTMTRGRDYLFEPALSYIDNRNFKTLGKLLDSGYEPMVDHHRLGLLCSTKDVAKCPREIFEPFLMAGLKRIAMDENKSYAGDQVSALAGRYLGCAQTSSDNLAAFKARIWPEIMKALPGLVEEQWPEVVQRSIAAYPSPKCLSIARLIMDYCQQEPQLLGELINEQGRFSHFGPTYNPFEPGELKYSNLPPKFFNHESYFNSILQGSIPAEVLYGTFPAVIKSKFDYSALRAYGALSEMAKQPMLDILAQKHSLALDAALIIKLTPVAEIMDVFSGPSGKVEQFLFQECWKNLATACSLPATDMQEVACFIAPLPVIDILHYRKLFFDIASRNDLSDRHVENLDAALLAEFTEMAKAKEYLEALDLNSVSKMRTYCAIAAENTNLGVPNADRFATRISWKNQAMRDTVFGGDLGL